MRTQTIRHRVTAECQGNDAEYVQRILPSEPDVRAAIPALTGAITQRPPSVSAKQVGGVRAHAAARQGRPLDLAPVSVQVHAWDRLAFDGASLAASITCGGGTYVRALARDLGRAAGSAAHCAALRRLRAGCFDVADAVPALELRERGLGALRAPASGLHPQLVRTPLDEAAVQAIMQGRAIPASAEGARGALIGPDGRLVAIAERRGDLWQPTVVLRHA